MAQTMERRRTQERPTGWTISIACHEEGAFAVAMATMSADGTAITASGRVGRSTNPASDRKLARADALTALAQRLEKQAA